MKIITLTLNPALDKSTSIDKLEPESKLRCEQPVYEPGGGGINISRVLKRLGAESTAVFAAGGPSGKRISDLLRGEGVAHHAIASNGWTRENLTVYVRATQRQYRFVMPGAEMETAESQAFLDFIEAEPSSWIVISGSLPAGVSDDFFTKLAQIAQAKQSKLIVDTSGEPLKKALDAGVFMIKPNLKELTDLSGKTTVMLQDQEALAMQLVNDGKCEIVVVSLGARGAMLASKSGIYYATPPTVVVKSTVGAGDSMVAGMLWALTQHWSHEQLLRYGVACGTATTMNEGTELCHKKDIENIYNLLNKQNKG